MDSCTYRQTATWHNAMHVLDQIFDVFDLFEQLVQAVVLFTMVMSAVDSCKPGDCSAHVPTTEVITFSQTCTRLQVVCLASVCIRGLI